MKYIPTEFSQSVLHLCNQVLYHGMVPLSWKDTVFTMLPKKTRAVQPSDFRPVANTRLFYKVFAYMLLGRVEDTLEIHQPEAQHGFRPNRRLEEHLVTANLFLDKAWSVGMTVWVVSLDLSKAPRTLASSLDPVGAARGFATFDMDLAQFISATVR